MHYESFAAWKADQSAQNQELINALQALIEHTAPYLTTLVKWGQGCWADGNTPKVFIHAEEDHVQLGFYGGSLLRDPHGLLAGNGKFVRFVRVYSKEEINPDTFGALIKQAIGDEPTAHPG